MFGVDDVRRNTPRRSGALLPLVLPLELVAKIELLRSDFWPSGSRLVRFGVDEVLRRTPRLAGGLLGTEAILLALPQILPDPDATGECLAR